MRISDWSSDVCSSDLPAPCGRDPVLAIEDRKLDDQENAGGDHPAEHRRYDPARRDAAHARPVDGIYTGGSDAAAGDRADDGMGGGDGRAQPGGEVEDRKSTRLNSSH